MLFCVIFVILPFASYSSYLSPSLAMIPLLRKTIFVLFVIAVTMPMFFLLVIAMGDVTTTSNADQWGCRIVKQLAFTIAVLWFLDLILLVLTLALKTLISEEFSSLESKNHDDLENFENIDEEFH